MILQHPAFCFWHDYITSPVTQHWPNSRQPPCPLSLRFDLVHGWVIESRIDDISLHIYRTLQHILLSFPIFSYGIKITSLFPTPVLLRNAWSMFLALILFSISKKILCIYTGARWRSWKSSCHTLLANLSIALVDSLKAIPGATTSAFQVAIIHYKTFDLLFWWHSSLTQCLTERGSFTKAISLPHAHCEPPSTFFSNTISCVWCSNQWFLIHSILYPSVPTAFNSYFFVGEDKCRCHGCFSLLCSPCTWQYKHHGHLCTPYGPYQIPLILISLGSASNLNLSFLMSIKIENPYLCAVPSKAANTFTFYPPKGNKLWLLRTFSGDKSAW